jgi:hypothetical protein
MGQHVQLGIAPGDEAPIVPDEAIAIVEGEQVTSHGQFLPRRDYGKLYSATNAAVVPMPAK